MTKPIPRDDTRDTFVIEGVITGLQVALDREALFAQIPPHGPAGGAAARPDAVPGDLRGQLAAAASILYYNEDTEYFVCLIGQQVVYGEFGGASKLPVGRQVRAVVEKCEGVLVAHGILSGDTGLVWVRCPRGSAAENRAGFQLAWWLFCFAMAGLAACVFLIGVPLGMGKLETLAWGAVVAAALCFGMAAWDSTSGPEIPGSATDIFRKLGFADPGHVDLNSYQYSIVHGHALVRGTETRAHYADIHCYQRAVEDGKVKLAH
ncbi:hypothetical protein [Pseudoduganella lutea]|uniref:Uncharacterized protein n=1 Tax=Pseudoduganella lutea TaxID=321985 RepID=A0A4P6L1W6_9BURK|nr:hypothetical protein [Pseudoduganella lutea]QBE65324.1 hypothetical protein EWM63_21955 [Pseudoduganella lutea]